MMLRFFFIATASLSVVHAFHPVSFRQDTRCSLIVLQSGTKQGGSRAVDWKRAKHCAEHFGACDVDEVEQLYSGKQHFVFRRLIRTDPASR